MKRLLPSVFAVFVMIQIPFSAFSNEISVELRPSESVIFHEDTYVYGEIYWRTTEEINFWHIPTLFDAFNYLLFKVNLIIDDPDNVPRSFSLEPLSLSFPDDGHSSYVDTVPFDADYYPFLDVYDENHQSAQVDISKFEDLVFPTDITIARTWYKVKGQDIDNLPDTGSFRLVASLEWWQEDLNGGFPHLLLDTSSERALNPENLPEPPPVLLIGLTLAGIYLCKKLTT